MKDLFLFFSGGCFGAFVVVFSRICRELYGFHQEDKVKLRCKLCGKHNPDGFDVDIGPVCAQCEVELHQVGAQLVRLSDKIL